jgi:hypothetical protein
MGSRNENLRSRKRLIYFILIIGFLPLFWTLISDWNDFGIACIQYLVLGTFSIIGIYFLPDLLGIEIFGIDDNYFKDLGIGILMGIGLIFLSILRLVGSFVYGASIFSVRVSGAGVIETAFFFILMIPLLYKMFKDKKNILKYLIVCFLAGFIFAFFHYAVVTQGSTSTSTYGFFISASIIAVFWGLVLRWTKSALPLIISHMILNFYILNQQFQWIVI